MAYPSHGAEFDEPCRPYEPCNVLKFANNKMLTLDGLYREELFVMRFENVRQVNLKNFSYDSPPGWEKSYKPFIRPTVLATIWCMGDIEGVFGFIKIWRRAIIDYSDN
jgi:hypothetical protein